MCPPRRQDEASVSSTFIPLSVVRLLAFRKVVLAWKAVASRLKRRKRIETRERTGREEEDLYLSLTREEGREKEEGREERCEGGEGNEMKTTNKKKGKKAKRKERESEGRRRKRTAATRIQTMWRRGREIRYRAAEAVIASVAASVAASAVRSVLERLEEETRQEAVKKIGDAYFRHKWVCV